MEYDISGGGPETLQPSSPFDEHIRDWPEDSVAALLKLLGYPFYEQQLKEHGITGEILIYLDHEALKDVGIHSVGQRLSILKAVYNYKLRDDVPIESGHWVPPTEDLEQALEENPAVGMSSRLLSDLFSERDDRIRVLELEVRRLNEILSGFRDEMQVISKALYNKEPPAQYNRNTRSSRSPVQSHFPSNSFSSSLPSPMSEAQRIAMQQAAKYNGSFSNSTNQTISQESPAGSPGTLPFQQYETLADPGFYDPQTNHSSQLPHTPAGLSNSNNSPASPGPTSPNTTFSARSNPQTNSVISTASTAPSSLSFASMRSSTTSVATTVDSNRASTASDALVPASRAGGSTSSSSPSINADHPYRSFKVTLEDPCYKVLPAALKKYKINDDWREYALFICYGGGTTERCLSYDEKPLLLFQKLKEAKQNPVFMLRHIKDIKSPIQVATAKHAARKEKKAKETAGGTASATSPLSGANDTRSAKILKEAGNTNTTDGEGGAVTPTVASLAEKDKENQEAANGGKETEQKSSADPAGPHPIPLPSPGSRQIKGYCISIYPYLAEREDEFDVAVGDTFVIVNKAKGWWTVYRDNRAPGSTGSEQDLSSHSGWVPAGCLLETSVAPLSLAPSSPGEGADTSIGTRNAANIAIKPSMIVSVSTPGLALMDFKATGSDELKLVKGQMMRVYKRYNHWSYAIKDDTGERGWTPSWFVGKVHKAAVQALPSETGHGSPSILPAVTEEPLEPPINGAAPLSSSSSKNNLNPYSLPPIFPINALV